MEKQMVKCGCCEHDLYALGESPRKCPVCAAASKEVVKCSHCGHEGTYPTSLKWWECEACGYDGVGR